MRQNQKHSRLTGVRDLDLRVSGTLTRHKLRFDIPQPTSTASDHCNPDKVQLRADILIMRERGMSYREIAGETGLHHSRVWQIVNSETSTSDNGVK